MSAGRWAAGGGAVVVLVATGAWARWPGGTGVDADLWSRVRPVVEARLLEQVRGSGAGEPGARWFCRAQAVDLEQQGGLVRAGVSTLCLEYGVRARSLVECSGAEVPQVMRLRREADGEYVVVSVETAPDGAGHAEWVTARFGHVTAAALDSAVPSTALEAAARRHFGLPADAPVGPC
ncbi:hypothetical protein [Streptomyces griseorubiginosus]|uniref:hypothetical protein n=1 Tax=Streptomyces griseorubiginosus TaxID=67304 RepID=UPI0011406BAB|nr:hypothetical protein [Streptomyces griseorubiginosus]